MSDGFIQPCLQESDDWESLYSRIERERSLLEEIAAFENQVSARLAHVRDRGKGASEEQNADLAGLKAHDNPPRPLSQEDIDESQYYGRSKRY